MGTAQENGGAMLFSSKLADEAAMPRILADAIIQVLREFVERQKYVSTISPHLED